MEISGINLKTRELRQPHSIPNKQHMTPQLAPAWKELLLPNPRKVTAKHKLLLVSCSNSVFWRVCQALASASYTCALFWNSGLLLGIWGLGLSGARGSLTCSRCKQDTSYMATHALLTKLQIAPGLSAPPKDGP